MPQWPEEPSRNAWWQAGWTVPALCLALLVCGAAVLPRTARLDGMSRQQVALRLAMCLLALEAAVLAAGAPFAAARACPVGATWVRWLRAACPFAAAGVVGFGVTALAAHGVPRAALAWSQVLLLAFALVVASLTKLVAALGTRPSASQAVATLVAFAMLANVFYANTLVEMIPSGAPRMSVVNALLWTNPWLIAGGTILTADPIRSQNLYAWSVLSYYGFTYPGATAGGLAARSVAVTGAYAVGAAVLQAFAHLARRLRTYMAALHSQAKSA